MRSYATCYLHILGFLAMVSFIPSSRAGQEENSVLLKSAQLSSTRRVKLLSKNDYLFLPVGGGKEKKAVRMTMRVMRYKCMFIVSAGTNVTERTTSLICYTIQPLTPEVEYSWAWWTSYPVIGVKLFADKDNNYLAWIDGPAVYIEEISSSRDTIVELSEYLKARRRKRMGLVVTHFAGREFFKGDRAQHANIEILSVGKDRKNRMRVKVRGHDSKKIFEFVLKENKWQLEEL